MIDDTNESGYGDYWYGDNFYYPQDIIKQYEAEALRKVPASKEDYNKLQQKLDKLYDKFSNFYQEYELRSQW